MSAPYRLLSLCSGYGGLDLAATRSLAKRGVVVSEIAYFAEIDPHAATVFEANHPGVPNLGDFTAIDWSRFFDPTIRVITAGYPCQPFSHAGRRKGTDDVRHLWPFILEAIRNLRPDHVFLENVSGHRSLGFDHVLGDLASVGFHARWTSLRASDVGAPHHRDRLFIYASPADAAGS